MCAAAGDFWPTMTLAVDGDTAWVACKEQSRIESLDGEELRLEDQAIAVLSAFDAIWALDSFLLLASGRVEPTGAGYAFVIAQALVVLMYAEFQFVGLRRSEAVAA